MKFDSRFVEEKNFKSGIARLLASDTEINTANSPLSVVDGFVYAQYPQIVDAINRGFDFIF